MTKVLKFIKNEIVLVVAAILAVASAFVVTPNKEYIDYIDFRTLALLFCLMVVVAGWQRGNVFDNIAAVLLAKIKNTRQLVFILVMLCFITSMFITNDVALITFVPFACLILKKAEKSELLIYTVVMQTVAANLGSILLPIGNPQNLYLYGISGYSMGKFIWHMFPLWILSFVLIVVLMLPVKKHSIVVNAQEKKPTKNAWFYLVLFVICLITVADIIPYYIALAVLLVAVLVADRKVLLDADYLLLVTFVCFFIFIGNLKNMSEVAELLAKVISGRELYVGIASSQVCSNVPAAILLTGFTDEYDLLMWGVNIGGLGTLIASMASLISYKIYMQQQGANLKKYMITFTAINVLMLVIMIPITVIFFM